MKAIVATRTSHRRRIPWLLGTAPVPADLICVVLMAIHLTVVAQTSAATFISLGYLRDQDDESEAVGVSADGRWIIGNSNGRGFRWSEAAGFEELVNSFGAWLNAEAISADGRFVVGESSRWSAIGSTDLGFSAKGISGDGSVIVGYSPEGKPVKWTNARGVEEIRVPQGDSGGWATAVSSDGKIIIGFSRGKVWTHVFRADSDGTSEALPEPPNYHLSVDDCGISADGSVIVGNAYGNMGDGQAFIWRAGKGTKLLGVLAGYSVSYGDSVSGDGEVVVGTSTPAFQPLNGKAFVWDAQNGMRDLQSLVTSQFGLSTKGWTLTEAKSISTDANTIVGTGLNPQGHKEAWVVRLNNSTPVLARINFSPVGGTTSTGEKFTFSISASGSWPMSFQWQKDGTNITGATNSTLEISKVKVNDSGIYRVLVTNSAGTVASSEAFFAVTATGPPAIAVQPQSRAVNAGATITFSVVATGTPQLNFQWRKDGVPISGATNSTITLVTVTPADEGTYSVLVTNAMGQTTSSIALLTLKSLGTAPIIIAQPRSQIVYAGGWGALSVTVSGTPPLNFQWRKDGVAIAGATNSTVTIPGVLPSSAGVYSVRVSNSAGSVTSSNADLTVSLIQNIVFAVNPSNRTDVINFYRKVYQASEGIVTGWNGDVGAGEPGSLSPQFLEAVRARINWFRAMAGLPGNVQFNPEWNRKCQLAALMFSANKDLQHFPPRNWLFYSEDGAEAARKSNLTGDCSALSIDRWIQDPGHPFFILGPDGTLSLLIDNALVGHRRGVFASTDSMGFGGVDSPKYSNNSLLWIGDRNRLNGVAWPPPGFIPWRVVFSRWSFEDDDTDFTDASVEMTKDGIPLGTVVERRKVGLIVWHPSDMDVEDGRNGPQNSDQSLS